MVFALNTEPFLGSSSRELLTGSPALFGCPLDLTSTYRKGTGEAPQQIRLVSDSIETYSPLLDRDVSDTPFSDLGDLELSGLSIEAALEKVRETAATILENGAKLCCIGGEHTLTLPIVQAIKRVYPEILILHIDAHSDLRDSYEGSSTNHATVMKLVSDLVGSDRLVQLGIRAGTREEFDWMHENGTLMQWTRGYQKEFRRRIADQPVYLSLDLDVLDPSCLPGTGNPESGGWFYEDIEILFRILDRVNLVATDIVELNPTLDRSGASSIITAKIVREILLILGKRH
jgi:agmatinase